MGWLFLLIDLMKNKTIDLSEFKSNPNNPRIIRDAKFYKLVESIKNFPKMMKLRPIIVNDDNIILGGNMRYKALQEAGYKSVPEDWIKKASELTEEEQRQFIIKDNVGFGEWDWELLANEWEVDDLNDWGLDMPDTEAMEEDAEEAENEYSKKISAPNYEPTGEKPEVSDVFDFTKTSELLKEIESSNLSEEEKDFLKKSAQRHTVINFEKVAELYCHASKEMQELMEKQALVIIDFDKAVENGYVEMRQGILDQFSEEYNEEDDEE